MAVIGGLQKLYREYFEDIAEQLKYKLGKEYTYTIAAKLFLNVLAEALAVAFLLKELKAEELFELKTLSIFIEQALNMVLAIALNHFCFAVMTIN